MAIERRVAVFGRHIERRSKSSDYIAGVTIVIMELPRLIVARQKFPDRRIPDVAAEVHKQLAASNFAGKLKPGARVAIGTASTTLGRILDHRYRV